jgi:TonB-linked SusC/RagA family outer membrane protein
MLEQMYNFYPKKLVQPRGCTINILLIMKLTTLILITAILQVSANTFAQKITLSERNAPLNKIFEKISDQTGFDFLVSTENLKMAKSVTINVQNEDLKSALDKIFTGQPLSFVIQEKMVVVSKKALTTTLSEIGKDTVIHGIVTDESGRPLVGATVKTKGKGAIALTNNNGLFDILVNNTKIIIMVSYVGYQTKEYLLSSFDTKIISIQLLPETSSLNQVQIIGYGTTTKRFNTGSTGSVSAKEIETQPVSNPLSALQGKVSGVLVQTQNGLPGGAIKVQIRGQGSLASGTDPLYVVDGIPFLSASLAGNTAASGANGAISPLSIINPNDILSIDILKDADATAIYGSRAANGVVLITTKKGVAGKDKISVDLSEGISKISRLDNQVLNLPQYLKLRKDAFANDGILPDVYSAPDLLSWDTTKTTDWQKYFYAKAAHVTTIRASLSGGDELNSYLFSLNYRNEGTILPGDERYIKGGGFFNFRHSSQNKKFNYALAISYDKDDNKTLYSSINNQAFTLPPNFPVYNPDGSYNWDIGNPVASLLQHQESKTDYLNINNNFGYRFSPYLNAQVSVGYNSYRLDQVATLPLISQNPSFDPVATAYFGNNLSQRYIIEPQLTFQKQISKGSFTTLIGATYQRQVNTGSLIEGDGVSNPSLLGNIGAATTLLNGTNSYTLYKYASIFSRVNYNWAGKYIIDVNFRRDGSSRFGPNKQFGNFYAVGAAWLFSEEPFFKNKIDWLSYGKLRSSIGTTGNDQISDYQYLASYGAGTVYGGSSTLSPTRVANPNYSWETTHKVEGAVELGFLKDRILFTAAWYRHLSSNQLIQYKVPVLTGFASYQANFPAEIENTGLEFDLNANIISAANFKWNSSINATLPHNKLKSFPNIEGSTYANTYRVGQDLSAVKGYQLVGIDPQTGLAIIKDQNGDGVISIPADLIILGKTSPDFFGGWSNSLSFNSIELNFSFEFVKRRYPRTQPVLGAYPSNDPLFVQDRWEKPGDITSIPRASVNISSSQFNATNLGDASYARLKNVGISFSLPTKVAQSAGVKELKLYLNAENLLVFANKDRFDPEISGAASGMPPLKTIVVGLKTNF